MAIYRDKKQVKVGAQIYTHAQLYKLCGLKGIHPEALASDKIVIDVKVFSDCAIITISSISIRTLQVIIYPNQRYIWNECIVAHKTGSGIAAPWVRSQVRYSGSANFKYLKCSAHRNDTDPRVKWTGYLIWLKFGYLMEVDSVLEFHKLMKQFNRSENTLQKLMATKEGEEFWRTNGFSWYGSFNLKRNSASRRILRRYRPFNKN